MIILRKVVIDKNKCIGCFTCKHTCYEVFDIDSDGKARVRTGAENNIEEAKTAIINCPTNAIKIINTSSHILNHSSLYSCFLLIIIVLFIFYGYRFVVWKLDSFKGNDYILSTKYNSYVSDIAENHISKDVFIINRDDTTNDSVNISYIFNDSVSKDNYEELAYNEVSYVYNSVKDVKIKKDEYTAPKGKDLIFVFYINNNGNYKEIGRATIFYLFGKLDGEDYIEHKDKIIYRKS